METAKEDKTLTHKMLRYLNLKLHFFINALHEVHKKMHNRKVHLYVSHASTDYVLYWKYKVR
jgi:hypothetical protein